MKERKKAIYALEDQIVEIYRSENLIPLRGKDSSYLLNGKPILKWFGDVTRRCWVTNNELFKKKKINYHLSIDDLLFSSDEIIYFNAHLYLYRDFINNPVSDSQEFNGHRFFPMHENLASKRYDMYLGAMYEKVYNYWDRIGDLISSFFPEKFKGNVYFGKTINKLSKDYISNPDLQWLINFVNGEYKKFNDDRIDIVHYISKNTSQKWQLLKGAQNLEDAEEFQQRRLAYPEYFKSMNETCKIGFEKTLNFLSVIDETIYKDADKLLQRINN